MDSSVPFRREPCTPKSKNSKVRLNKPTPKLTPTRNRKRYDPQRRLEVAETRRNGACARCREKKVRVSCRSSQAFYESELNRTSACLLNINRLPAEVLNQREITCPNSSRISRDDALTGTNNGITILGVERLRANGQGILGGCPEPRRGICTLHRGLGIFKKASRRSRSSNAAVNILEANSRSMTRGSSQQSERSLFNEETLYSSNPHANETDEVKKGLSDLGHKTYINRGQAIIPPTSIKSTNGKETMLFLKDRNRSLRPKSGLVEKAISHPAKEKLRALK